MKSVHARLQLAGACGAVVVSIGILGAMRRGALSVRRARERASQSALLGLVVIDRPSLAIRAMRCAMVRQSVSISLAVGASIGTKRSPLCTPSRNSE